METKVNGGNNTKTKIISSILLLLTALIWGVAFVVQSEGGDMTGPYTFNGIRFLIAGVVLFVFLFIKSTVSAKKSNGERKKVINKKVLFAGLITGTLLAVASNLQQLGITLGSSVGKAGFLTAVYIVLVPIISLILFKKKCGINVWIGVVIALVGLYLLCGGVTSFELPDLLLLACALSFAMQIIMIDKFAPDIDVAVMSCIEFFVCGILSCIPMIIVETIPNPTAWATALTEWKSWLALLYGGAISGAIGYTLQAVGQKGVNPTVASLIMSLESVFAALSGFILLGQVMSLYEIIGCVLMFIAIVFAQVDLKKLFAKNKGEQS